MENVDDRLSFPQRHWLILCIIVAIVSPLLVNAVQSISRHQNYENGIQQKPVNRDTGGSQNEKKDTSYKVAAPPQHK